MNHWLRQSELKDMAQEFINFFMGKIFISPEEALAYFNKIKIKVYKDHPDIKGELNIKLQIVEKIPGKQYWIASIRVEDA